MLTDTQLRHLYTDIVLKLVQSPNDSELTTMLALVAELESLRSINALLQCEVHELNEQVSNLEDSL